MINDQSVRSWSIWREDNGGLERQFHIFWQTHRLGDFSHLTLGFISGFNLSVLDCGQNEILNNFFIVAGKDRRINIERFQLALGGARGLDKTRTGFAGDDLIVHIFLQFGHFALHILRGLHHFGHVAHLAQSFEHLRLPLST